MTIKILRFLNIVLAALLAGTSFGIWMGFNPIHLSYSTYVEQQQNLVRSLNTLMISMVIVATLITIAAAWFERSNKPVFVGLLIAAGFFIACILISKFGNQPIQEAILTWKADQPPSNWKNLRDHWWWFHKLRTITELIALVIIAWMNIKKGKPLSVKR